MAAVKQLIAMAKEKGFFKIAQVLESAYVDDCNSSVASIEDLEEIKLEMPEFMKEHGMPIKALAWTGEEAPKELSEDGSINIAEYSWNPVTDKMKVTIPKIFHGEKKKGRFTPDRYFLQKKLQSKASPDFTRIRLLHMNSFSPKRQHCMIRLDS